ncbi:hypothetical protein [Burkholderia sp. IMCC1007]|uniref:hypothetical protein n=1 Tax=Burkholderia sp. IMCC1007 TaxID=3004104 RepID=UPI0022B40450|nr:hypothetical protein [Burkholderia sp. IMCC1007]
MKNLSTAYASTDFVVTHALDPSDAIVIAKMRAGMRAAKGIRIGVEARDSFDSMMESVLPHDGATFEFDTIGGVPGYWVYPRHYRSDDAILHLHA